MSKKLPPGSRLPIRPRCEMALANSGSWVSYDSGVEPALDSLGTPSPADNEDRYSRHWMAHVPHTGRRPPTKGIANFRGSTTDANGREIVLESTLEYAAATIALAHRRVKKVSPQVGRVDYSDTDGDSRYTTFDFVVSSHRDTTLAIAIKPKRKVASSGIASTVAAIRDQHPEFSDEIVIWTEDQMPRCAEYNAGLVLRSRKLRNDDDVSLIKELVGKLHGIVDLGQLVRQSPLGHARSLTAIVNLIDEGVLIAMNDKRIDPTLPVRLAA